MITTANGASIPPAFRGAAIVTICHTESEDEIHIISMRKAELHEIEILSRYL